MKKQVIQFIFCFIIIIIIFIFPAESSSLPDSSVKNNIIGLGSGISISYDFIVFKGFSLGFSTGLPILWGLPEAAPFSTIRYDLRGLYKISSSNELNLSLISGIWGDYSLFSNGRYAPLGFEGGIGLSYKFTEDIKLRFNLVAGISIIKTLVNKQVNFGLFAPSSGIELEYKLLRSTYTTFGINGQGDIFGLKVVFN